MRNKSGQGSSLLRKIAPQLIFVVALMPSLYLAWISRDMPQFGRLSDDGIYWVCAKALAQGEGYRILNLPNRPWQTKYPPLYPLLLSSTWRLNPDFPNNLRMAASLSWLLFLALLLVARRTFIELGFGYASSWILCAFLALNGVFIMFSQVLMTELMFTCLLLGALQFLERSAKPESSDANVLVAGVLAAAAFLTKVAGAPLLLIVPPYLVYRKKTRAALWFLIVMLPPVIGWAIWTHLHQSRSTDLVTLYHTSYFGFHVYNLARTPLFRIVQDNLAGILSSIGGLFAVNPSGVTWIRVMSLPVAILAIVGTARATILTGALVHLAYTISFLLSLLLWHFPPDERYLMPVFPIFLAGLAAELRHIYISIRRSFRTPILIQRLFASLTAAALCALGLLCAALTVWVVFSYLPNLTVEERRQLAKYRKAYAWIKQNTSKDSYFLAQYDTRLFLYTHRPATRLHIPPFLGYETDRRDLLEYLAGLGNLMRQNGIHYALVGPSDLYLPIVPEESRRLQKRLFSDRSIFDLVYNSGEILIYRLKARQDIMHRKGKENETEGAPQNALPPPG